MLTIAREARIRAEIYHLKAAGKENWGKLDDVIAKIEAAQKAGLEITADMYTYTAGATGLDAAMPPWVQEGGYKEWAKRLQDPEIRERRAEGDDDADRRLGEPDARRRRRGDAARRLQERSAARRTRARRWPRSRSCAASSVQDTAMDLVVEDGSRVQVVYFLMSEDNVRRQIRLPWVSFGSDAASMAPEGVFLKTSTHPRAYGNFARLLGKYVRDEQVIPLEEAMRKLTSLPAATLQHQGARPARAGLFRRRRRLRSGDDRRHATYEKPHQYSTGMRHVWVNGVQVLKDGEHTGAKPGRVVRGPGWKPTT